MLRDYRYRDTAPSLVEALESRRLLSVTPLVVGGEALLHKASIHAHAGVPVLTGAEFTGVATESSSGHQSEIQLTITSESKSGALKGTLVVEDGGGSQQVYSIRGNVNHLGKFVLHASGNKHRNAVINGSASADGNTLIGHYNANDPGHHGGTGTFSLSR
jgi:hypothetical protein